MDRLGREGRGPCHARLKIGKRSSCRTKCIRERRASQVAEGAKRKKKIKNKKFQCEVEQNAIEQIFKFLFSFRNVDERCNFEKWQYTKSSRLVVVPGTRVKQRLAGPGN